MGNTKIGKINSIELNPNIMNTKLEIWWWNMGKKTLDFEGTVKEYLDKERIFVQLTSETEYIKNYMVHFSVGDAVITIEQKAYLSYVISFAIKMFLTKLGDKALVKFNNNSEFHNNEFYVNKQ